MGTTGSKIRITHPFHPLCGQVFELVVHSHHWGENRVVYADANGELRSITVDLTDFYPPDEFRQIADGRAAFRTLDLIGLWQVLDQPRHEEEADDA